MDPMAGPDTLVHATLLQILSDFNAIPVPSPHDLLRVRAAIEALGIAGLSAALTSDADTLVGFLNSTSRDVRATTAKALGNLCIQTANTALLARFVAEQSAQVRLAISAALRNLKFVCPGGM
jgi:HEAT repeat protein